MRASRYRDYESEAGVEVNISPLIDIVFLLLIFFIVTTVFIEETGVDVEKPSAATSAQLEKNSLFIAITRDGRIVHGQRELSLNSVRGIVARRIREKQVPVVLQADVKSETGLLVDVHDECKLAGAEKVFISTVAE